jgi:GntR family transcriptional regulator of vanillate catabolism
MDPIIPPGTGPRGPGSASPAGAAGTVARLRQLIAEGHFARGERLAEETVAAALGVSRTPVRLAFRTLAQEGLLQRAGKRGHVVRDFSPEDVRAAVEVRGVLEGLAARRLAEQGLPGAVRAELHACLAEGEAVLAGAAVGRARDRRSGRGPRTAAGAATVAGRLTEAGIARWSALNARFHAAIVQGGGRTHVIADAIARNNHLPFASADSIRVQKDRLGAEWRKLQMAQMQHRLIVEALEQREGARVEALMREHANIGLRYGALFGLHDGIEGAPPAP